jgi:Zn-dependent protease
MWVSLAGPFSNLLLAILAAIPFRLGLVSLASASGSGSSILPTPAAFLVEFIFINLILMLFNLIPLAPLDGEKIASYFFPPSWSKALDTIRPYGPLILIALLFVGPLVGLDFINWIIMPPLLAIFGALIG